MRRAFVVDHRPGSHALFNTRRRASRSGPTEYGEAQVYYIQTDHLNTPRLIANQQDQRFPKIYGGFAAVSGRLCHAAGQRHDPGKPAPGEMECVPLHRQRNSGAIDRPPA